MSMCCRKLDFGSYLISYTGLRAGVNLLTVKERARLAGTFCSRASWV